MLHGVGMVELLVRYVSHLARHWARHHLLESSLRTCLLLMPLEVALEPHWLALAYVGHELVGKRSQGTNFIYHQC